MHSHDASRRMVNSFARHAQLTSLLLLGCVSLALAADKAAAQLNDLGDDFLEYLGSLESDEENWMDFAAAAASSESTAKPQASASQSKASASSSASSQAQQPVTHAASVNTSATSKTGKVEK